MTLVKLTMIFKYRLCGRLAKVPPKTQMLLSPQATIPSVYLPKAINDFPEG